MWNNIVDFILCLLNEIYNIIWCMRNLHKEDCECIAKMLKITRSAVAGWLFYLYKQIEKCF